MRHPVAVGILVLLGGCGLYFGPGDDDSGGHGSGGGGYVPDAAKPPSTTPDAGYVPPGPCTSQSSTAQHVRNPETTTCQWACSAYADEGYDYWGLCNSPCNNLGEQACRDTPGCSASYKQLGASGTPTYFACSATAQSVTIPSDDCYETGGAYGCSQYDHCSMYYVEVAGGLHFDRCAPDSAPIACTSLATEGACLARIDCKAIYEGSNCTCDANGCTCVNQTFDHCQAR